MTNEEIKQEDEAMYSFLGFLLLIPLILTKGGAFYLLHKWFVFPMTDYAIGFWRMVGLVILIDTINMALREPKLDRPAKEIYNACQTRMLGYAASILFGWLATLMM